MGNYLVICDNQLQQTNTARLVLFVRTFGPMIPATTKFIA